MSSRFEQNFIDTYVVTFSANVFINNAKLLTIDSNLAGRANCTLSFTTCGEIRSFVMTGDKMNEHLEVRISEQSVHVGQTEAGQLVGLAAKTNKTVDGVQRRKHTLERGREKLKEELFIIRL